MISLGGNRNMKGILTSCGQGCVIVGGWRIRDAARHQLFNKGFAGWYWRTKITHGRVLGKCDGVLKTRENAIQDKSTVQFNIYQSLSPFRAVSCAYDEGGRENTGFISSANSSVISKEEGREESRRGGEEAKQSCGGGRYFFPFLSLLFFSAFLNKADEEGEEEKKCKWRIKKSVRHDWFLFLLRSSGVGPPAASLSRSGNLRGHLSRLPSRALHLQSILCSSPSTFLATRLCTISLSFFSWNIRSCRRPPFLSGKQGHAIAPHRTSPLLPKRWLKMCIAHLHFVASYITIIGLMAGTCALSRRFFHLGLPMAKWWRSKKWHGGASKGGIRRVYTYVQQ